MQQRCYENEKKKNVLKMLTVLQKMASEESL